MKENKYPRAAFPTKMDLRPFTRPGMVTAVMFEEPGERREWFTAGRADLRQEAMGGTELLIRYAGGVTDFEHDLAFALRLPLIGLKFETCYNGAVEFSAWVDPRNERGFRVPAVPVDPAALPGTVMCDNEQCGNPHPIVPEGWYAPPHDPALFAQVAGRRVKIVMYAPDPKDDEE